MLFSEQVFKKSGIHLTSWLSEMGKLSKTLPSPFQQLSPTTSVYVLEKRWRFDADRYRLAQDSWYPSMVREQNPL
jgi:hypothetical protein